MQVDKPVFWIDPADADMTEPLFVFLYDKKAGQTSLEKDYEILSISGIHI